MRILKYLLFIIFGILLFLILNKYIEKLSIGGLKLYFRKIDPVADFDTLPEWKVLNLDPDEIRQVIALQHAGGGNIHELLEEIATRRMTEGGGIMNPFPQITGSEDLHQNIKEYQFRIGDGRNNDDLPGTPSCSRREPEPEPEPEQEVPDSTQLCEGDPLNPCIPVGYRKCNTFIGNSVGLGDPVNPFGGSYTEGGGEFLRPDIYYDSIDGQWYIITRINKSGNTVTYTYKKLVNDQMRLFTHRIEDITLVSYQDYINKLAILNGIFLNVYYYSDTSKSYTKLHDMIDIIGMTRILSIGNTGNGRNAFLELDPVTRAQRPVCIRTNQIVIYEKDGVKYEAIVLHIDTENNRIYIRVLDHLGAIALNRNDPHLYYRHRMTTDMLINPDSPNLYILDNEIHPVIMYETEYGYVDQEEIMKTLNEYIISKLGDPQLLREFLERLDQAQFNAQRFIFLTLILLKTIIQLDDRSVRPLARLRAEEELAEYCAARR